ncbi:hypothetical protein [Actinoplanes teichomyceticus]|uniref:Uncharacterized protein n=1 Tax=Actinoplanes teichomyceticus TaxID=1867 RepID=A0A561VMD3_ACTTI|nr:hypothetical protein [Actinoplanes teichomyceticus]TWG12775.1 hypothetical protein FHX34_105643 [Actinoplanes teichomyceticus]GIF13509.1 hypothetical protein Ate01nite_35410 [Actinoplanes teichomyceticus]
MTDHWGDFDDHDLPGLTDHDDLPGIHEPADTPAPEEDLGPDPHEHPTDPPAPDHEHPADPPAPGDTAGDDFPPPLHVDELPEPVDGFPWIDTATLGDPDTYQPPHEPVDPAALADHAGIDIPDGADPWTTLAASDDPAVSALARWWTPDPR